MPAKTTDQNENMFDLQSKLIASTKLCGSLDKTNNLTVEWIKGFQK